jgi:hypothetical protein
VEQPESARDRVAAVMVPNNRLASFMFNSPVIFGVKALSVVRATTHSYRGSRGKC